MNFYKQKRSFFIIEILLGFFLLGIFIATSQNIPKLTVKPLIEMAASIKINQIADRAFLELLKSDLAGIKDLKPKNPMIFSHSVILVAMEPLFSRKCEMTVSISLEETKEQEEKKKLGLFKADISLKSSVKNGINKNYSYYFTLRMN
jgi:hypothetical protein